MGLREIQCHGGPQDFQTQAQRERKKRSTMVSSGLWEMLLGLTAPSWVIRKAEKENQLMFNHCCVSLLGLSQLLPLCKVPSLPFLVI